jgi:hypothetical protein
MNCPICEKGVLQNKKVAVEKYGTFVGEFNAQVCSNCKERIFSGTESSKIEAKIKQLSLWGVPVESRIYKVGGNFVVSIKKTVADAMGISKPVEVRLIPQVKKNQFIVEIA